MLRVGGSPCGGLSLTHRNQLSLHLNRTLIQRGSLRRLYALPLPLSLSLLSSLFSSLFSLLSSPFSLLSSPFSRFRCDAMRSSTWTSCTSFDAPSHALSPSPPLSPSFSLSLVLSLSLQRTPFALCASSATAAASIRSSSSCARRCASSRDSIVAATSDP